MGEDEAGFDLGGRTGRSGKPESYQRLDSSGAEQRGLRSLHLSEQLWLHAASAVFIMSDFHRKGFVWG